MKLNKTEKLHLIRIGLIPFFAFSLLYDPPNYFSVAAIIFAAFWLIKAYAKYLVRNS